MVARFFVRFGWSRLRDSESEDEGNEHVFKIQRQNRARVLFFLTPAALVVLAIAVILLLVQLQRQWNEAPVQGVLDGERATHNGLAIRLHPKIYTGARSHQRITLKWTIATDILWADGVAKRVYLVNGAFPGPLVEARVGDTLVIEVTNQLPDERVSLHWHGLAMRGANDMDGAEGVSNAAVPARGGVFVYEFPIGDTAGTYWWHAHSQLQRADGLYGGLIVHPWGEDSLQKRYEFENDFLLLIGDWYHRNASDVLDWYKGASGFGNEPVPDSLLLNGAGNFDCSMAVPARPIQCTSVNRSLAIFDDSDAKHRRARLRVVNTGSLAGFALQVSSATITPITVDGGFEIEGFQSDSAGILYPGQRVDMIIEWDPTNQASSQLHINFDTENFRFANPSLQINQTFPMFSQAIPSPQTNPDKRHFDLSKARTIKPLTIPDTATETLILYARTERLAINENILTAGINRTTFVPQTPPLLDVPRSQWNPHQFVPHIRSSNATHHVWVDLVINNLDDGAHPFHMHGYSFYVLATSRSEYGWGSYVPGAVELDTKWVVRRDTVAVPRRGFAVVRFEADNVGIWMLHCHMLFHQASGMAMALEVGRSDS
ncbi:ferro-O2-oxidoreductase [Cladochytrium replicatum]|nr:ferro-O2-oxidoreductase [Cladochytrium replicatum]